MEVRTHCTHEQAVADFRAIEERFRTLAGYTREQLLWRPCGNAWCITECVEHVALANAAYLEKITVALPGAAASSSDETLRIGGWLSALLLKSVSPRATRKLKAPSKIQPMRVDPDEAFARLAVTNAEIIALLEKRPLPNYNVVRFQNPFTVSSAFLILAAHAQRHLAQAELVSEMPEFPTCSFQAHAPELSRRPPEMVRPL